MPIRSFVQNVYKTWWGLPYMRPFAIGWGVVMVMGFAIPVTEEDKEKSPIYKRARIQRAAFLKDQADAKAKAEARGY